jgi:hypothetical protein
VNYISTNTLTMPEVFLVKPLSGSDATSPYSYIAPIYFTDQTVRGYDDVIPTIDCNYYTPDSYEDVAALREWLYSVAEGTY